MYECRHVVFVEVLTSFKLEVLIFVYEIVQWFDLSIKYTSCIAFKTVLIRRV